MYTNGTLQGPCGGDAGAPAFLVKNGTRTQIGHAAGTNGATDGICGGPNGTRGFLYVDYAPFVGWIHRRISGCGNYPVNKLFKFNNKSAIATMSGEHLQEELDE